MMEIYTPKEWSRFFGGAPSLYIKDDGYIYTREEEVKLMGRPCGRIDYRKGYIYGNDYASVNPNPVGYLQSRNGITEIYAEPPGWNVKPILVIQGNEIYTYSDFTRITGGNASGYIKNGGSSGSSGSSGHKNSPKNDGSFSGSSGHGGSFGGSGSSGGGCLGEIGIFAVIIGIFLLLTLVDEIRQRGAKFWIPFIVLSGLMFWGRHRRNKHAQSKSASNPKPSPTPQPKSAPGPQPKPMPIPQPEPEPQPQPAETKIIFCPRCGAKCRIPAGNGRILMTCPNPACHQRYEINT